MENQEKAPLAEEPKTQDSILLDVADMSGYEKSMKNARIWLYIICVMQVGMGVFEYFQYDQMSTETRWLAFGIDAGIGMIFLACALWSYKQPAPAFITALVLYVVISLGLMILNPVNLSFGIIVKIFVVIALYKAYKDARDNEELRQSLGA